MIESFSLYSDNLKHLPDIRAAIAEDMQRLVGDRGTVGFGPADFLTWEHDEDDRYMIRAIATLYTGDGEDDWATIDYAGDMYNTTTYYPDDEDAEFALSDNGSLTVERDGDILFEVE